MQYRIKHPSADTIRVVDDGTWCGAGEVQITFFKDGKCVVEPIVPFSEHRLVGLTAAVYTHVPSEVVEKFIALYEGVEVPEVPEKPLCEVRASISDESVQIAARKIVDTFCTKGSK